MNIRIQLRYDRLVDTLMVEKAKYGALKNVPGSEGKSMRQIELNASIKLLESEINKMEELYEF